MKPITEMTRKHGRPFLVRRVSHIPELTGFGRERGVTQAHLERFLASKLFIGWSASIDFGISIKHIQVVSIDHKSNGEPIFAKLLVEARDARGKELPGIVFLRGGSVAIMPILVSKKTQKRYLVFTMQARLAVGDAYTIEIPAGMLDGNGNFAGIAAKEFKEEIGLSITSEDLICLTPTPPLHNEEHVRRNKHELAFERGIHVSPGACDETMRYYLYMKELPEKAIRKLNKRQTGNKKERESIQLMVVPLKKAARLTADSKFFTAWALAKLQKFI